MPNTLSQERPEIENLFREFIGETKFPEGTDIGPSGDTLQIRAGGDAADWIAHELGIPAAEAEIGSWEDYNPSWLPKSTAIA